MNNLSPQTSHAPFDPSDTSLPTLASQQGWLINRLSRRRADMLIEALAPLNLSAREAAVLGAVRELPPPIAQLEIGAALALDQGSVAVILEHLERQGLLTRERDQGNRRRNVVVLTAEGRRFEERAAAATEAVEQQLLAALDDGERATLLHLLGALARSHDIV
jgi:DNA-binding MarR family transcriptional regulator